MSFFDRLRGFAEALPSSVRFEIVLDDPGEEPVAPDSPASLPTEHDPDRERSLDRTRRVYRFERDGAAPPHTRGVPATEEVPSETRRYIERAFRRARMNEAAVKLALTVQPPTTPHVGVYGRLFQLLPEPRNSHLWNQDDYFAWLFVAGVNAGLIERLDAVPADLQPHVSRIEAGLPGGSLEDAVAQGRILVVDLTALGTVPLVPGRHLVPSLCLFHRHGATDKLAPLAILLSPEGRPERLFTPRDPFWNWQLAKAFAMNANNLHHQAVSHYLETHQVVEIVTVALHRSLHPDHPVFRLLHPHIRHSISINTVARKILVNDDGLIEESMSSGAEGFLALIEQAWAGWRWDENTFEGSLDRRGLAETSDLSDYPYRDDGIELLDILRDFVGEVLREVYASDDAVGADRELQAWMAELGSPTGGDLRGLPALDRLDALVDFVTEVIFKATGLHQAMQGKQYDEYGFVPSIAASLYGPLPDKDVFTELDFLSVLPDVEHACKQISTAWVLTRPTRESLLDYALTRARSGSHRKAYEQLCDELIAFSGHLRAENAGRLVPYEGFDPQLVPARIEI